MFNITLQDASRFFCAIFSLLIHACTRNQFKNRLYSHCGYLFDKTQRRKYQIVSKDNASLNFCIAFIYNYLQVHNNSNGFDPMSRSRFEHNACAVQCLQFNRRYSESDCWSIFIYRSCRKMEGVFIADYIKKKRRRKVRLFLLH